MEQRLVLERMLSRDTWMTAGCLAAISALSWVWLIHMASDPAMMAAMVIDNALRSSGPISIIQMWSWAYFGSMFAMWVLMMVAMMLPSAAPMILLYARMSRTANTQNNQSRRLTPTFLFAGAYLFIWALYSLGATVAQWGLVTSGVVGEMSLAFNNKHVAAALLLAAGLYQITPVKRICLDRCRSPLFFLMRFWRPGIAGGLRLGMAHGAYCLGCCWLLMALLFVGGAMNLVWVAILSGIVIAEKLMPAHVYVSAAIGILFILASVVLML